MKINPVRYFVQIFRIFKTYYVLSNDIRMNVKILYVSKTHFPDKTCSEDFAITKNDF